MSFLKFFSIFELRVCYSVRILYYRCRHAPETQRGTASEFFIAYRFRRALVFAGVVLLL